MNQTPSQHYGTGRRKTSIARVYLRPGTGKIVVNKRDIDIYFERESSKLVLRQPLEEVAASGDFDIYINVCGGGKSG
jgi:small subunit ribosomal protein S9